jgi:hypothetical protein
MGASVLNGAQHMKVIDADPTPAAPVRPELERGNAQPDVRVRFNAADGDDAGRLDAVAGCEFVDDRMRLRE